jgi:hypothetical protein
MDVESQKTRQLDWKDFRTQIDHWTCYLGQASDRGSVVCGHHV